MIDYRKILGTRSIRTKVLSMMSWVPDILMINLQYFLQLGKFPNLKHPKSFNEFIQAYKLTYRDPQMLRCTDKYEVRKYLEERGFGEYLVPLIGVYNKFEDIDFTKLPERFVIKTTDGGGGNEVIICKDKSEDTIDQLKKKVDNWMIKKKPKKHIAREWAYDNGYLRRIIVEELLEDTKGNKDIDDFKFYCYNGKFKFMQWHKDRFTNHRAGHFDENLKFLPEICVSYPSFDHEPVMPDNIEEMREIAEKVSKQFPFVRVDLYSIKGRIYIGELTFYPASGYFHYQPEYVDNWLGSFFTYPFHLSETDH